MHLVLHALSGRRVRAIDPPAILVRYLIGIGTYTGFDDSIGLRVAEAVAERGLDRGFRAIELGGTLLDLVHYLDEGAEAVLVVDSARMGLTPGAFAFFKPEQVESRKSLAGFSTHEADLLQVLDLAGSVAKRAAVSILGIEPESVRSGIGLSNALETRFDEYIAAAVGFFADQSAG